MLDEETEKKNKKTKVCLIHKNTRHDIKRQQSGKKHLIHKLSPQNTS